MPVKVRIVVGVHAALECLCIGGSIEEPRGDAQRTYLITRFPRSADLISLAIHFASSTFPAEATV
jgi:hypothetical protein